MSDGYQKQYPRWPIGPATVIPFPGDHPVISRGDVALAQHFHSVRAKLINEMKALEFPGVIISDHRMGRTPDETAKYLDSL